MAILKVVLVFFLIFAGIPCQLIDYKHRKRKDYVPGNAWAYYSKLSREGNFEGRFILWSGYIGIGIIVVAIVLTAYKLFTWP